MSISEQIALYFWASQQAQNKNLGWKYVFLELLTNDKFGKYYSEQSNYITIKVHSSSDFSDYFS